MDFMGFGCKAMRLVSLPGVSTSHPQMLRLLLPGSDLRNEIDDRLHLRECQFARRRRPFPPDLGVILDEAAHRTQFSQKSEGCRRSGWRRAAVGLCRPGTILPNAFP